MQDYAKISAQEDDRLKIYSGTSQSRTENLNKGSYDIINNIW